MQDSRWYAQRHRRGSEDGPPAGTQDARAYNFKQSQEQIVSENNIRSAACPAPSPPRQPIDPKLRAQEMASWQAADVAVRAAEERKREAARERHEEEYRRMQATLPKKPARKSLPEIMQDARSRKAQRLRFRVQQELILQQQLQGQSYVNDLGTRFQAMKPGPSTSSAAVGPSSRQPSSAPPVGPAVAVRRSRPTA